MTKRDDEREGADEKPIVRPPQKTLMGVGTQAIQAPRTRAKTAFSAHPQLATSPDEGDQNRGMTSTASNSIELDLEDIELLSVEFNDDDPKSIEMGPEDLEPLSIDLAAIQEIEPLSDRELLADLDAISELDLAPDELLEESSADEFSDEATQIGEFSDEATQIKEFSDEATQISAMERLGDVSEHHGMFAAFDAAKLPAPKIPAPSAETLAPKAIQNVAEASRLAAEVIADISADSMPFVEAQALPAPIYGRQPALDAEGEDFEAMKTQILSSPYETEAPVVKMHVLDGPAKGQEFFVSGMRTTVGRGESNSAMIPDGAMSRQHFEIVRNPDETFTLYDLQSVNGTALNGTRIRQADLFHGDRIEAGKSTFQFLIHGQMQQPARQRHVVPALTTTMTGGYLATEGNRGNTVIASTADAQGLMKLSTMIIIAAGTISVILIGVITFLLWTGNKPEGPSPKALASQRYLQGVEAVQDHDWDTAEALFVDAQKLDPQLDVGAQMQRLKQERAAKIAFEQAKKKFAEQAYDEAARYAEQIPKESTYYSDAQAFSRRPQTFAIDQMYAKAQEKVTADDLDAARALIKEIQAHVPDHQGAADLLARIKQIDADRQREADLEAERARNAVTTASHASLDPFADVSPKRGSSRMVNFTEGYRLYKARKFDEASAYFAEQAKLASGASSERAAKTSKEITSFKKIYADALDAWEARDWKKADKLISQARRVDSAVAGGRGYFDSELATKLADARANLGLQAFEQGDFIGAYKHQRDAEKQDASHPAVKALRNKLLIEARNNYIKAANARKSNPNEAAKLCRTIMGMIAESEDTWKKAQKLLQEL